MDVSGPVYCYSWSSIMGLIALKYGWVIGLFLFSVFVLVYGWGCGGWWQWWVGPIEYLGYSHNSSGLGDGHSCAPYAGSIVCFCLASFVGKKRGVQLVERGRWHVHEIQSAVPQISIEGCELLRMACNPLLLDRWLSTFCGAILWILAMPLGALSALDAKCFCFWWAIPLMALSAHDDGLRFIIQESEGGMKFFIFIFF